MTTKSKDDEPSLSRSVVNRLLYESVSSNSDEKISKLLTEWETSRGIDPRNESLSNLFKPTSYFEFPDTHKTSPHFELPSVPWASLRGFTFTAWIRISFDTKEPFVGCLFDFHSKGVGGCGALLHFDKQLRLDYRCSVIRSSEWSHSTDLLFEDDGWHMITVSHSLPYLHKSRLRVYVDGVSRCDHEIPFPSLKREMNQCTTGHGLPPKTRIGALTLYGGVLPASAVRSLYGVGPSNYTYPISVPIPILRPWELLTTPALESQDLPSSREALNSSSRTPISAKKRRNDSESKLRRAAHSSRDVFVIFCIHPSLSANNNTIVLHRPVGFTKRVRRSGQVTDVRIMSKISEGGSVKIAKLCGNIQIICENRCAQSDLNRLGGIERLLDQFLEHESPSLTVQDELGQLEAFKVLASCILNNNNNNKNLNDKFVDVAVHCAMAAMQLTLSFNLIAFNLFESICNDIVFNFDLRMSSNTRIRLMNSALALTRSRPDLLRDIVTVRHLLDGLDVLAENNEEIADVLVDTIQCMVLRDSRHHGLPTAEELEQVMVFLHTHKHHAGSSKLLSLLVHLFNRDLHPMRRLIDTIGGPKHFQRLIYMYCNNTEDSCLSSCIRCLSTCVLDSALREQSISEPSLIRLFGHLLFALSIRCCNSPPVSVLVTQALAGLVLGDASQSEISRIVVSHALPLWMLSVSSLPIRSRHDVMLCLCVTLKTDEASRKRFLSMKGWPRWLLRTLPGVVVDDNDDHGEEEEEEEEEEKEEDKEVRTHIKAFEEIVLDTFSTLIDHELKTNSRGWKIWIETVSFARELKLHDVVHVLMLKNLRLADRNKIDSDVYRSNLVQTVEIFETIALESHDVARLAQHTNTAIISTWNAFVKVHNSLLQNSNLEQMCSVCRVMCRGLPLADVETAGTVLNSIQLLLDSLSASSSSDSNGTKSKQQQFVVVTRIMVYLRETIALTRSSELQEMYAAFVVAVANNYYISKTYKKRLSAKLLDIASSQNNSGGVIDVYTSVSACFEIFANEMHEAEREERDRKQKKRKTHASMKQSRVEIACSETSKKEQEELVLNALLEYANDNSFEMRRRERITDSKHVYAYWNRLRRKRKINRRRAKDLKNTGLWIRDTHEDRQRRCLVFRKSYRDVSDLLKPHSSTMSTIKEPQKSKDGVSEEMLSLSRSLSLGIQSADSNSISKMEEEEMEKMRRAVDEVELHDLEDEEDEDDAQSPSLKEGGGDEDTFQDEDDEDEREPLRETRCVFVRLSGEIEGTFRLWSTKFVFTPDEKKESSSSYTYKVAAVVKIHLRRYRLRESALEIFLERQCRRSSAFFHFVGDEDHRDESVRNDLAYVFRRLVSRPRLVQTPELSRAEMFKRSNATKLWQARKISNFEYLMTLNTYAGRTHNDPAQYFVFPWILGEYVEKNSSGSEESFLNLKHPETYRDLRLPVGALNQKRLAEFRARYDNWESDSIPKYMYGSHYSTAVGTVLFYLLRLQPFAELHCRYQSGHFDCCDRLFKSIPASWKVNVDSLSEVKELVPEFYYSSQFLVNVNRFDFGETQSGERVADVRLPFWSKNCPEEFVRIHREALESEFVSQHLHHWIDLIFGYKQRGKNAERANNVFFHLTYFGAVDVSKIKDPVLRQGTEMQIAHFGQCPAQLFTSSHPARGTIPGESTMKKTSRLIGANDLLWRVPTLSSYLLGLSTEKKKEHGIEWYGSQGWASQILNTKFSMNEWTQAKKHRYGTSISIRSGLWTLSKRSGGPPWSLVFDLGQSRRITNFQMRSSGCVRKFSLAIPSREVTGLGENVEWSEVAKETLDLHRGPPGSNHDNAQRIRQFRGFDVKSRFWRLVIHSVHKDHISLVKTIDTLDFGFDVSRRKKEKQMALATRAYESVSCDIVVLSTNSDRREITILNSKGELSVLKWKWDKLGNLGLDSSSNNNNKPSKKGERKSHILSSSSSTFHQVDGSVIACADRDSVHVRCTDSDCITYGASWIASYGRITSISIDDGALVTGDSDGVVLSWRITVRRRGGRDPFVEDRPLCRFDAHSGSEIKALSVCRDLDVVISISERCGVYMHTFSETRVLMHLPISSCRDVDLSHSGRFVVWSGDDSSSSSSSNKLQVFGSVGRELGKDSFRNDISVLKMDREGELVITATENRVQIRRAFGGADGKLELLFEFRDLCDRGHTIRDLSLERDVLAVGSSRGDVVVCALPCVAGLEHKLYYVPSKTKKSRGLIAGVGNLVKGVASTGLKRVMNRIGTNEEEVKRGMRAVGDEALDDIEKTAVGSVAMSLVRGGMGFFGLGGGGDDA